jgi:RNA polymerase sigma-70 factor (sigma-E family)
MPEWHDELSTLVHERHRALVGYAYLLCGGSKEAEDLVQDALVKTYSRKSTPDPGGAEAYVRRAILTIYLDAYRRRQRWSGVRHLVGRSERTEGHASAVSDHVDVAAALDALTPRQRSAVVLRYFEDLTVPQIAEQMGCSAGTVKRHLFDAHAVLKGRLGELAPLEPDETVDRFRPPSAADTLREAPRPSGSPPSGPSSAPSAPSTTTPGSPS